MCKPLVRSRGSRFAGRRNSLLLTAGYALLTTAFSASLASVAVAPVFAQSAAQTHPWKSGESVEVYHLNPGTHSYEWSTGTVTDVLAWGGAHVVFADQPGIVETIGQFDENDVNSTPPHIGAARFQGYKRGPLTTGEKAKTAGVCPCDPHVQEAPKSGAPRETLFKHLIWENHNLTVNGTLTSPLKVGVTFATFKIGTPHRNRFGADAIGRRGLEHSTAAEGELIYPITTRYTLWRQYRDTLTQTDYDGHFEAFREKSGGWVCPTAPGYQQIGSTR